MSTEQRPQYQSMVNTGNLFKNKRKETEKQPDFTGDCNIDGKPKRVSAWTKTDKNGVKYLSLAFSEPRAPGDGNQRRQAPPQWQDQEVF